MKLPKNVVKVVNLLLSGGNTSRSEAIRIVRKTTEQVEASIRRLLTVK